MLSRRLLAVLGLTTALALPAAALARHTPVKLARSATPAPAMAVTTSHVARSHKIVKKTTAATSHKKAAAKTLHHTTRKHVALHKSAHKATNLHTATHKPAHHLSTKSHRASSLVK